MQNRSFQAYPITLYSNKEQYRVCLNPITDMWELRSAQGRRLNASRDIFVLARQIQDKDTLIIPKGTEHVDWLPDSVFKDIEEYSLILRTHMLIGVTDFSHIDIPEATCYTYKLSREQLISLGFMPPKGLATNIYKRPSWWMPQCRNIHRDFHEYLYAEKPFT